jgi:preprotein translocase subunit YajC
MDLEYQKKIDDIHNALVGNPLTNDGGLIHRVKRVEDATVKHDRFISRIKWSGGVVVTIAGIFGYAFDKFIDLFKSH